MLWKRQAGEANSDIVQAVTPTLITYTYRRVLQVLRANKSTFSGAINLVNFAYKL